MPEGGSALPTFRRGPSIRQERIGCFSQSKAGQALIEFGKLTGKLSLVRRAGSEGTLVRRNIGQRFARHPCIASARKFRRAFEIRRPPFKDGAVISGLRRCQNFALRPLSMPIKCMELEYGVRWLIGFPAQSQRCSGPTPNTATLPQSARCQEPWHLSIQTVARLPLYAWGITRWRRSTLCAIDCYLFPSIAHEFCYSGRNPWRHYSNSLLRRNGKPRQGSVHTAGSHRQ